MLFRKGLVEGAFGRAEIQFVYHGATRNVVLYAEELTEEPGYYQLWVQASSFKQSIPEYLASASNVHDVMVEHKIAYAKMGSQMGNWLKQHARGVNIAEYYSDTGAIWGHSATDVLHLLQVIDIVKALPSVNDATYLAPFLREIHAIFNNSIKLKDYATIAAPYLGDLGSVQRLTEGFRAQLKRELDTIMERDKRYLEDHKQDVLQQLQSYKERRLVEIDMELQQFREDSIQQLLQGDELRTEALRRAILDARDQALQMLQDQMQVEEDVSNAHVLVQLAGAPYRKRPYQYIVEEEEEEG